MKLLDAGEVLPDELALRLVAPKLSSVECQTRGWVLEGIGTAGGIGELESAIAAAAEVGVGGQRRKQGFIVCFSFVNVFVFNGFFSRGKTLYR